MAAKTPNLISTTSRPPLRVGILGTASIARKSSLAILHPSSRCSLSAVASRSASRAADFVQRFGASSGSVAYGSYGDLIADPDIDAIYVPLPTSLHLENVTLALRAGKHVLVEKPISVSLQDYRDMIDAASLTRRVIMDGTMFVHEPVRLPSFLKACTTDIGKVDRIESEFSFHGGEAFESSNIRMQADGDPLGCVGDMAWYSIRAAMLVYGRLDAHSGSGHGDAGGPLLPFAEAEAAVATHFETNANGVPFDVSAIVYFKGNRTLHLHCGFRHALRQSLRVVGTRRVAVMDDFVLPRKGLPSYYMEEMSLTDMDVYSTTRRTEVVEETGSNFVQEVCLWRNFALLAHISGRNSEEENGSNGVTVKKSVSTAEMDTKMPKLTEMQYWTNVSFHTQAVVCAIMKSIEEGSIKVSVERF
mmetsp:Transcript_3563/g.7370  ORF Transcript_3563/g.7370 Transcript_3563/m.7370 type:complete len:417 (-) Transcript_3563:50-1300(-)